LYNRVNTYGLTNENKHKEEEIIAHILKNNQYPPHIKYNKQTPPNNNTAQNRKWITFTYFGPCMRMISKIFRNTNMKVAFRTNNTLRQHLKIKEKMTDKYNQSGVYQMACQDCELKYIGQTGRTFRTRYKEHIRDIKINRQKSRFAQHILNTTHNYGTMEQTMTILHPKKKGKMLNALENYHIYELTKENLQMNEALTDGHNQIYEILIKTKSGTQTFTINPPPPALKPTPPLSPTLHSHPTSPHPLYKPAIHASMQ
jgi:hypothetical protein